jgi:membrane protein YdbS with pleckstrin-like domain
MANWFFKNYSFRKDPDEKIIFRVHRHWVTLVLSYIKAFLSLLVIFLIIYFVGPARIYSSLIALAMFAIWFLVTMVYIFFEWIVWWLDLYILTTKRIVDIEQRTLFSRQVSETSLDRIQDVTFEIKGVLATLFNYGNVRVETAGSETIISLDQVGDPEKLQKTIFNTANKDQKEFHTSTII